MDRKATAQASGKPVGSFNRNALVRFLGAPVFDYTMTDMTFELAGRGKTIAALDATAQATTPRRRPALNLEAGGFLDVRELADDIGVNKSTIRRWVQQGKFPEPVHISRGCTRWRTEDYAEWKLAQKPGRK